MRRPEGQGLNDLYVRFFRMAERRIVEKTGQGVICFISNCSWLDGLSFPGMRQRYLEVFDAIRIDNLNGDKYKTGKVAPDGSPDPSIFSTDHNREGIQVGTTIATLVRKRDHANSGKIEVRDLWGRHKRQALLDTSETNAADLYQSVKPVFELRLPFLHAEVESVYFDWPSLPDLLPTSFPGIKTSRDEFLVDVDLDRLRSRIEEYFDAAVPDAEIARRYSAVMKSAGRFDGPKVRSELIRRGLIEGNFVRYAYRPFDVRWLYWEPETKLLDEKRSEYWPQVFAANRCLVSQKRPRRTWSQPQVLSALGCLDLMDRGATCLPAYIRDEHDHGDGAEAVKRPNLTASIATRLADLELGVEDLFHHIVAVLHCSAYRSENAAALRMDWPRVPFPTSGDAFAESAGLGRELASLLDPQVPTQAVTVGGLRTELKALGVPSRVGGGDLMESDLSATAGWGSVQGSGIVMPGTGLAEERDYGPQEV